MHATFLADWVVEYLHQVSVCRVKAIEGGHSENKGHGQVAFWECSHTCEALSGIKHEARIMRQHDKYIVNYLSTKEGSLIRFVLFCSYEIHRTRMLQIVFLVSSRQGGVHGLGSMTFGLAVQKFFNIE
jgi:hypothetical protein